ncbi:hypothetical protein BDB00DRAFT_829033 [Zychaea mexicana]|uniref:uncharacterized protein n=1 Tax=Zychaea mexicana TaxID=64656 RepID=UPI0022FE46DF|nr:uncharacterized protein BDB00DRAFT_829033 [Zychaea mexicana]KAI9492250.1 hypothetical protein BDB00DRAFT_829033 [Zychaea mexicana]
MTSLPFLFFSCLLFLSSTVLAGEGTYPLAYITGPEILENSTHIPTGYYTFRHVETGKYLQFIDFDNQIVPTEGANSTVFNGTLWTVKWHGDKNYSIHHLNKVKYDKCVSTRWDHHRGLDDAAVMWQCEVDNITRIDIDFDIYPGFNGVYNESAPRPIHRKKRRDLERRYINTYESIREDKQQWVFMRADPSHTPLWNNVRFDPETGENHVTGPIAEPDREKDQHSGRHQFYLVSAAHLWNMIPRCIYPQASYEFDFTANNTGVTALDHCLWGNSSQLWEVTLWKPESFPLGFTPNPMYMDDQVESSRFLFWNAHTSPGSTILWWGGLVGFSFLMWIWH